MGKIVLILMIGLSFIQADNLEQDCLSCHKAQQIPSQLIYRRYLMRYSTAKSIEIAMAKYLKDPKKATSIMPPQFFLKFPMKEAVVLDKNRLESDIQMFIEKFDIKKKLRLKS
jgi:hypothetical protein